MTTDRDFDRLARAWLETGPDEAPDRVIAAVLQAAEITPQVRRGLRWPHRRSFSMTRTPVLATLGVAIAVAVGGGLLLTRPSDPATIGPAPSSSTPATAPSSTAGIPADIRNTWFGAKRSIPGMPEYQRFRFRLTDLILDFPDDNFASSWFTSMASAVGPDELRLVAAGSNAGCRAGDEGRYTWSLSPGGVTLTIVRVQDACPDRAAALAGDWIRVACKDATDGCIGDLEAGTFPSQYLDPRVDSGETWSPNLGAVTYTVPAGWSNSADWPKTFSLTPSADYALETASGPPPDTFHGIFIFAQPAATTQNEACTNDDQTSVARSASRLMGWVTSRPSLTATVPIPITIGALSGESVDLKVAPSWIQVCPDQSRPSAPRQPTAIFLSESGNDAGGWGMGLSGDEKMRLILLDLGDGTSVAIAIDSTDPARYQALLDAAMPIIESFRFK